METTKLSTKGQIVIPEIMRRDFNEGTIFRIVRKNDLIVLNPIPPLNDEELQELNELKAIWKDIDEGKGITLSKEDFLKEMESW